MIKNAAEITFELHNNVYSSFEHWNPLIWVGYKEIKQGIHKYGLKKKIKK